MPHITSLMKLEVAMKIDWEEEEFLYSRSVYLPKHETNMILDCANTLISTWRIVMAVLVMALVLILS